MPPPDDPLQRMFSWAKENALAKTHRERRWLKELKARIAKMKAAGVSGVALEKEEALLAAFGAEVEYWEKRR